MGNGEISPLPVCRQVCTRNRPEATVKYLPGENNQLADCLSRLGCLQDKIKLPRLKVHLLTTRLSATSDKLQQI